MKFRKLRSKLTFLRAFPIPVTEVTRKVYGFGAEWILKRDSTKDIRRPEDGGSSIEEFPMSPPPFVAVSPSMSLGIAVYSNAKFKGSFQNEGYIAVLNCL